MATGTIHFYLGTTRIAQLIQTRGLRLFPGYKNALPLGQDCGLFTGRGGRQTHFLRSAYPIQRSRLPVSGIIALLFLV